MRPLTINPKKPIAEALLLTCAGTLNFNLATVKNRWGSSKLCQDTLASIKYIHVIYIYISYQIYIRYQIYIIYIYQIYYIYISKTYIKPIKITKCHQMWIIHHRVGESFPPHLCIQRGWPLHKWRSHLHFRNFRRNHRTKCQNLWKKSLCQKRAKVKEYLNRLGENWIDSEQVSQAIFGRDDLCIFRMGKWLWTLIRGPGCFHNPLEVRLLQWSQIGFLANVSGVIERSQSSQLSPKKTSPKISQTCFGENNLLQGLGSGWVGKNPAFISCL